MKALRDMLDRVHPHFAKGGLLEKAYPMYEALDTFLYTPGETTKGLTHVRDGVDLKRMMITVVLTLLPVTLFGMWNVGYQANMAIQQVLADGAAIDYDWHGYLHANVFGLGHDPGSFVDNFIYGLIHFLPIYLVTMIVGGHAELIFSVVRGHEINEGFLVTGLLFALILPPTIPLWQVAIGIIFGVVVGKEIFGGTGRNFLNPALTARAFLYFAHAEDISGDAVWTAVDGYTAATPLGVLAVAEASPTFNTAGVLAESAAPTTVSWMSAFLGTIQGSIGETSTLLCIVGAIFLIASGIGSWRIMLSMILGVIATTILLNQFQSETNPMFAVPFWWHLVTGGLAFGVVWMATDPVSASMTRTGKWFYGGLIGFMTVLIRVVNPAFPEGVMLAILFGNVFAPLIDYFVMQANIRRRAARYAAA
ncbi:MAG: NADH:ubiquinone reductase (Na(+)-transporting) subunit B [Pirellulaceae bacterium]